ncbi:MAG: DNA-3-methyladenine glycosylase [Bacteroidia bacterium]
MAGGPGTVSQALGIRTEHSGLDLTGNKIWIEDKGIKVSKKDIIVGPRVGVDYAAEDAKLPYRFIVNL